MNHLTMQDEPASFQNWINYSLMAVAEISDSSMPAVADRYLPHLLNCMSVDNAKNDGDDELFRVTVQKVSGAQLYAIGRRLRDLGYVLKRKA